MTSEVRFGLALNGGVSLAIWIGGVADELVRAVSAGSGHPDAEPEYVDLCRELDTAPKIDVLVGTSAGGVNGAFLAVALVNDCANLTPLQKLWIDTGDFTELLDHPTSTSLRSLLKGDSYFLPKLREALEAVAASGRGAREMDPPLDMRLTSTALQGRLIKIPDGQNELHTVDHAVEFRFTGSDFDFHADAEASRRVARACRSTASFPGAFEPSPVPDGLFERHHAPNLDGAFTHGPAYLVDGGVLNNLPARNAVQAIIGQPSRERVERVLALIVPDPGGPSARGAGEPLLTETVGASAVGIPRNQSLAGFVSEVRTHNHDVLGRRAARTALLSELADLEPAAAWKQFVVVSDALFPSYRAARHRTSLDRMVDRLSNQIPAAASHTLERVAKSADLAALPWVPKNLTAAPDDSWGGSPIRRLVSLLVTWTNIVAEAARHNGGAMTADGLMASKQTLGQIRASADRSAPVGAIDDLFLRALAEPGADPEAALVAALHQWEVTDGRHPLDLHALIEDLAGHLRRLEQAARPHLAAIEDPDDAATIRGLVTLVDGAPDDQLHRLLIGFEVIELAFGAANPPPDQTIRLAQFSATLPVTIDPSRRDAPEEKLAGVQMGHFAAFLKRSWRANDFMWGRLDAAERLVRLLDQATGDRLATNGRLDHHLRKVQTAILRDLLPVLACEIGVDGRGGARVSPAAKAFVDAVVAVGTPGPTPNDPVSLGAVSEDELSRLLALNLVGVERLADEAGSKRASTLSLNAITTGAALLRQQGPKAVRGPVRLISSGSLAVWKFRALHPAWRWLVFGVAALLAAGAVGLVLIDRVDHNVGPVVILAWGMVLLTALVAGGWAVSHGLRRRARPKPAPPSPTTAPPAP